MIAGAVSVPEIGVSDDEAKAIAGALAGLAREYNLGVSGKTSAWLNLATIVGPIIGAHYMAYRFRVSAAPAHSQLHPAMAAQMTQAPSKGVFAQ